MLRFVRAALLAVPFAMACTDAFGPDRSPAVDKQVVPFFDVADAPAGVTDPPTIRVADGQVEALGIIRGSACWGFDASASEQSGTLRIRLTAIDQGVVCVALLQQWGYRLTTALPPATERVVLEHANRRTNGTVEGVTTVAELVLRRSTE